MARNIGALQRRRPNSGGGSTRRSRTRRPGCAAGGGTTDRRALHHRIRGGAHEEKRPCAVRGRSGTSAAAGSVAPSALPADRLRRLEPREGRASAHHAPAPGSASPQPPPRRRPRRRGSAGPSGGGRPRPVRRRPGLAAAPLSGSPLAALPQLNHGGVRRGGHLLGHGGGVHLDAALAREDAAHGALCLAPVGSLGSSGASASPSSWPAETPARRRRRALRATERRELAGDVPSTSVETPSPWNGGDVAVAAAAPPGCLGSRLRDQRRRALRPAALASAETPRALGGRRLPAGSGRRSLVIRDDHLERRRCSGHRRTP